MRRIAHRGAGALIAGLAALALLPGAGREKSPPKKRPTPLKVEETIADLAFVRADGSYEVEGVGLVVQLDHTGSDPEPSPYRTKLLDIMRKARVENAERILASTTTSLVIVKGRIPVGISTRDHFDVDIEVPPTSTTTSLAGGALIQTRLSIVERDRNGVLREGPVLALAGGPVMTGTQAHPDDPRYGRILGGARVKKDMPYTLVLKEERKSAHTAALIEKAINLRFHELRGIDQKGMANAKTDQHLVLHVPQVYHENPLRYFQVIQNLPILDTADLRAQRQQRWGKELLESKTAGMAALKLEGIGRNAIDTLKPALASPNAQVRFFAAEALAYLGDSSGVEVLAETAIGQPDFRRHALAALAAMDQSAGVLRLRELMSQADPKLRYGAFHALRTVAEDDPYLGRVRVLDDPPEEEQAIDDMSLQIAAPRRRLRPHPDDPFELYIVDCEGPPLVHVARSKRNEIVIFGRSQKLLPPIVLGGKGPILLNATSLDQTVQVSRIAAHGADEEDLKAVCSLRLGDVIREAANLGATYPELLAILQAAQRQRNLAGDLVIDALPSAGRAYDEAQMAGIEPGSKKDAAVGRAKAVTKAKRPSLLEWLRFRR
jgi:flagellar basal body P-ring protein FlgI